MWFNRILNPVVLYFSVPHDTCLQADNTSTSFKLYISLEVE